MKSESTSGSKGKDKNQANSTNDNFTDLRSKEDIVSYGDSIKLFTTSKYLANTEYKNGGYIGVYGKGDASIPRVAIPPIGPDAEGRFEESVFRLADPRAEKEDGTPVTYGDVVVLVDKKGLVWNNKCSTSSFTGFFEGYLGPKPRGSAGELYCTFKKNGHEGRIVGYGDIGVYIHVVLSHRYRSGYNYRVTNYRSLNSRVIGGYLCADNTGHEITFQIHRHSGPPVQAYQSPIDEHRLSVIARHRSSVSNSIYVPPGIKYIGVQRKNCDDVEVMAMDPLYGKQIRCYNVLPEDNIIIELNQDTSRFSLEADQLFKVSEKGQSQNVSTTRPFVFTVSSTSKPTRGSRDLPVLEVSLEQDPVTLRRMFSALRLTEASPPERMSKIDILIACQKLGLAYYAFSIVLPFWLWKLTMAISDGLESFGLFSYGGIMGWIVSWTVKPLLETMGLRFIDGAPFLTDELRSLEASNFLYPGIGILMCFAFGMLSPSFARQCQTDHAPSRSSEGRNFVVSVEVPQDIETNIRADSLGDSSDTIGEDEESSSVNGVVLRGVWGDAGVDSNGVPCHPAFKRFLDGEKGNMEKAQARWIVTCDWRSDGNIDRILDEPHRLYHVIKANIPSYYYGRAKNGCPIYIDCPGGVNMKALKKAGVGLSELMFNFTYSTEFLWNILEPSEQGKTCSILDLEGVGMFDFVGEVIDYVKKTIAVAGQHYPERSYKMFIINAPRFFAGIWSVVKGLLDEATTAKIKILRNKYKDELLEVIDEDVLPVKYGGKNTTPLGQSEEDRLLESHICKILMEKNVAMVGPDGKPIEGSPQNLQQYVDDSLKGKVSKLNLEMPPFTKPS